MDQQAAPGVKKKQPREFDINKYPQRHIALKLAYHGHAHDGLAKQQNTPNTIEQIVCEAMQKVRLIPADGPVKFSRCGRTDKGVSALGNAFSLMVRATDDDSKPLDYCRLINKCLPDTIRIIGWSFVPETFDARFSCKHRTYRYFFSADGLNLDHMREAASHLLGQHDFRNFCKMDVVNVSNFVREVQSVDIRPVFPSASAGGLHYLEIRGNAFLYHQIRCTMTILFLVAQGHERPDIVRTLLDVQQVAAKPCYPLALDAPLVLWDCAFDPADVAWNMSTTAFHEIVDELKMLMDVHAIRAAVASEMRAQLAVWFPETAVSAPTDRTCAHVALMSRPRELTFEERIAGLSDAKRKRREDNLSKGGKGAADDGDE